MDGDSDSQLEHWWVKITPTGPQSVDNALDRKFGGHGNDFRCGIDHYSTYAVQGYLGQPNPP